MEKKYPVLKCNEELWNEIKPVLKSFGIIDFNKIGYVFNENNSQFKLYPYLVTNYGKYSIDKFLIGNTNEPYIDKLNTLRYLVNTKEEFLSAVAKLLGKEYPIKEQSSEVKYPCIKCTQQLYDRIKDILEIVGYKEVSMDVFDYSEYLIINYQNEFGQLTNLCSDNIKENNRYECSNIQEFLTVACELQGFKVFYINNTENNNSENHYFAYCINKEDKAISIYENFEEGGLQAIVIEKSVVSYDPAVSKDSTVVDIISTKGNNFDKNKGNDLNIDKSMEKINIADKLKHCKKGTKLYHLMFGEVEFDGMDNDDIFVITTNKDDEKGRYYVNSFGLYDVNYPNGKCLLFPSKDNRDWNNFQILEEGHRVMCSHLGDFWELRDYIKDNETDYDPDNNNRMSNKWQYIVPVEDFDFTAEDITINKEKSIV